MFLWSNSRGSIKLADTRDRALCDSHAKVCVCMSYAVHISLPLSLYIYVDSGSIKLADTRDRALCDSYAKGVCVCVLCFTHLSLSLSLSR